MATEGSVSFPAFLAHFAVVSQGEGEPPEKVPYLYRAGGDPVVLRAAPPPERKRPAGKPLTTARQPRPRQVSNHGSVASA